MRECVFPLTRTFSYKDRIADSVLILESKGQWKPKFLHTIYSVKHIIKTRVGKISKAKNFTDGWFKCLADSTVPPV